MTRTIPTGELVAMAHRHTLSERIHADRMDRIGAFGKEISELQTQDQIRTARFSDTVLFGGVPKTVEFKGAADMLDRLDHKPEDFEDDDLDEAEGQGRR